MIKQVIGAVGVTAVLSLAASSCSSGATSNAVRATEIPPTNFATIPNSTVKPVDSVPAGGTGTATSGETFEYTVKAGDLLIRIAKSHNVTLDALVAANQWVDGADHLINAGDKILIPGAQPSTDTGGTVPPDATDQTDPAGCKNGTYTIKATDTSRTKVAKKFDITVEALDAANVDTKGYKAFYEGLKIVIPRCPA